jgi:hypothetical protein
MTEHPMVSEDELLRMSLTGAAPASSADEFADAKAAGNACFAAGDYAAAIMHYAAASAADPSSAIPPSNMAMAQLRLNQPVAAAESATTALALLAAHPDRPGTMALLAKTLLRRSGARTQLGMQALAVRDLQEILDLQPGHEEATQKLRSLCAQNPGLNTELRPISRDSSGAAQPRIEEIIRVGDSAEISTTRQHGLRPHANGHHKSIGATANCPSVDASSSTAAYRSLLHEQPGVYSYVLQSMAERVSTTRPRDGAAFEGAWRTLRGRLLLRSKYIATTVGPARLRGGILGETLTAGLVEEFAAALLTGVNADANLATLAAEVMRALAGLPRFDLMIMFLSGVEKASICELCDRIAALGVDAASLRASFELA